MNRRLSWPFLIALFVLINLALPAYLARAEGSDSQFDAGFTDDAIRIDGHKRGRGDSVERPVDMSPG
ncbi:hypothetical protein, partial [Dermabacter hominis]